jgi:hypothetical protein
MAEPDRPGGTVLSFSTGEPLSGEAAAVDRFLAGLGDASWFSSLGMPPTDGEAADVAAYLGGLGLDALDVAWIGDLAAARRLSQDGGWSRAWWQAEERAVADLARRLDAALGKAASTRLLNRVMAEASKVVMGPAAVAAAREGVADQGLNRAMAGAAIQAVYAMALVVAAARDARSHSLAAKYRLFAAGHWPLVVLEGRYYVL